MNKQQHTIFQVVQEAVKQIKEGKGKESWEGSPEEVAC